jgi:hypothetical protein
MITFGEMTSQVQAHLRSFVRDQEQSTHLVQDINETDTKLYVADANLVSRGRIEIGSELLWVDKSVRGDNSLDIPPYGRGMDDTFAAEHKAGDRVIVAPLYPRKFLQDTLNQTIRQIGAQLYGVSQVRDVNDEPLITDPDGGFTYEMPGWVRDILSVTVTNPHMEDDITYLRDWTFDKNAPKAVSTTGKALYLYDDWIGGNLQMTITASRDPLPLTREDQEFWETTLPESAEDLPVLGAAARLLASSDAYAVQTRSVEAAAIQGASQSSGAAQSQSKYLQALFMQRLEEEKLRLLNSHVNRSRYQR